MGCTSFALGLYGLRSYVGQNLELVAMSASYTVEAALVFDDRTAATESIAWLGRHHKVASARVITEHGHTFAVWHRPAHHADALGQQLLHALIAQPVRNPVMHDGRQIGVVEIVGVGDDLLRYLTFSVGMATGCFVLSAAFAHVYARRSGRAIEAPLARLAATADAVRNQRLFFKRVAPADIRELDQLGTDFNALLDELEAWQHQVQHETASLSHQAQHDPLTGLLNRAGFDLRLQAVLDAARTSGGQAALLFLDGNGFKAINDRHGHDVGDFVLRSVADRLRAVIRDTDAVARLGGDEFAVLLGPLPDAARAASRARSVAEHIAEALDPPLHAATGVRIPVSLAIGIALYPADGATPAALLKAADAAMYLAKRQGSRHRFASAPADLPPAAS